jgi:hypothetical protein
MQVKCGDGIPGGGQFTTGWDVRGRAFVTELKNRNHPEFDSCGGLADQDRREDIVDLLLKLTVAGTFILT